MFLLPFCSFFWICFCKFFPSLPISFSSLVIDDSLSVQFTQSCLALWDPMDCSTPGFPVRHQLPELAQIHVHRVGGAIQPSYLISSHPHLISSNPSLPAFNLSQHQGFFQWVSSSHQVAKILELQFQHQSFQWIFRTDFL